MIIFRSACLTLTALMIMSLAAPLRAEGQMVKRFETRYTEIFYDSDEEIKSFFWRIGGKEIDIYAYPGFAKSRVDRIIEKVQSLLDMYPDGFKVAIYLRREYESGHIAFYRQEDRSITVYADRVTENVLAHEISHAVIHAYFGVSPPQKAQEILSQYVDKHLWSD
ncbi:MAG: hypothetical protein ABH875_05520 [Candidatus Omnitrophota bacterium]